MTKFLVAMLVMAFQGSAALGEHAHISPFNDAGTLGEIGDWSLTPYFAVDCLTAPASAFSATFKLVDLSDTPQLGDSAPFSFDFVTVPEPTGAALEIVALAVAAFRRR